MAADDLIVGRVPFLVCAPFFHATLAGAPGARFIDGVPSFLNQELRAGRIDCAPSSSFEYGLHHRDYKLFPGVSTSSRMEMKSVLFLSQVPWEDLQAVPAALSPDSDTSNVLFLILCEKRFHVKPKVLRPPSHGGDGSKPRAVAAEAAGAVFIGDWALAEARSGRWPYRYDLADVWAKWQGLPFSFGLWMARRKALEAKRANASAFHAGLRASLESFRSDPGKALDAWTRAYPSSLPRAVMLDFYATADYRFTAEHARSLEIYYRLACDGGYLEEMPELVYADV